MNPGPGEGRDDEGNWASGHWRYDDPYGPEPAPSAPETAAPQTPRVDDAFPPPAPPAWVQWSPAAAGPPAPVSPYAPMVSVAAGYWPPTNRLATAGMVLGIISIPCALFSFLDLPVAIVGLVLAIVGLRRARRMPPGWRVGQGKAVAGIATATAGLMFASLFAVWVILDRDRCSAYPDPSPARERCLNDEPQ